MRTRETTSTPAFEALERRLLMSAAAVTSAVDMPLPDLSAQIVKSRLPESMISGNGQRVAVPVTICNTGDSAMTPGQRINVAVYARPMHPSGASGSPAAGSEDVLLSVLKDIGIGRLGPQRSKTFSAKVSLPVGMASGTYSLVAKADSSDTLAEANEVNNEAIAPEQVSVQRGYVDLAATIQKVRLPDAADTGMWVKGAVTVALSNTGNIKLPRGAKATVMIVAVSAEGTEHVLAVHTGSVSGLVPGKTKKMALRVNRKQGLADGDYRIEARITSPGGPVEERLDNNTASVGRLTVTPPDLSVQIAATRLPSSMVGGSGQKGVVPIILRNTGDSAMAPDRRINVAVYARRVDSFGALAPAAGPDDVLLCVLENVNIGRLRPQGSKRISTKVSMPLGMDDGAYCLVAKVDSSDALAEVNEANNEAIAPGRVSVQRGYVDLEAVIHDFRLPGGVDAGAGVEGFVTARLRNAGNIKLAPGAKVTVSIVAVSEDGSERVLAAETASVSLLGPNKSKRMALRINRKEGLPGGNYRIAARITSPEGPAEERLDNNTVGIGRLVVTDPLAAPAPTPSNSESETSSRSQSEPPSQPHIQTPQEQQREPAPQPQNPVVAQWSWGILRDYYQSRSSSSTASRESSSGGSRSTTERSSSGTGSRQTTSSQRGGSGSRGNSGIPRTQQLTQRVERQLTSSDGGRGPAYESARDLSYNSQTAGDDVLREFFVWNGGTWDHPILAWQYDLATDRYYTTNSRGGRFYLTGGEFAELRSLYQNLNGI